MATITSAASGNFSIGATWVGGVVPSTADIAVAATGHIVAIDVNTTVTKVTQAGTGKFTLDGGITLTGNVDASAGTFSTGGTVQCTATTGTTATIVGNLDGPNQGISNLAAVVMTGTGTLTINGNITGTVGAAGNEVTAAAQLYTNVTCTLNVNGTIGSNGQWKHAILLGPSSNAVLNVITAGTVGGGGGSSAHGIYSTGVSPTLNITAGTMTGGFGSGVAYGVWATGASAVISVTATDVFARFNNSQAIYTTGTNAAITVTATTVLAASSTLTGAAIAAAGQNATITVTATNVLGGAGTSAPAINATGSLASVSVTSTNIRGGAGASSHAVSVTGASSAVTVVGHAKGASTSTHGIFCSASTANGVVFTGSMTDSLLGAVAVYARIFRMSATNDGITTYTNTVGYPSGTPVSRVSPNLATGVPSAIDVRDGTVYGFSSSLTGTLKVPPSSAVGSGVPVDATTGTAALSPADVAALVGAQIAAALDSTP